MPPHAKPTAARPSTVTPTAAFARPTPAASTRLYVQNLPAYVDTKRLRDHFASQGEVTDAVVVRTKDGAKSRRFGFVGYKTEAQAKGARAFFDQSFLDTCRLNVSFAVAKEGADAAARPWSKHTPGSSRFQEVNKADADAKAKADDEEQQVQSKNKIKKPSHLEEGSAAFQEFMETVQARSKSKFWANDDVQDPTVAAGGAAAAEAANMFHDDSDDDDDEVHEIPVSDDDNDDDAQLRKGEKKTTTTTAGLSDLDFLRSKVSKKLDKGEENDDDDHDDEMLSDDDESNAVTTTTTKTTSKKTSDKSAKTTTTATATATTALAEQDEDKPTARLFVRNLPFTAVEEDLTDLFADFGAIVEVHMPLDETKRRKGFGFVQFHNTVDAQRALETLNGFAFQGRRLHVIYGRVKPEKLDPKAALEDPNLTYKQKKDLERQLNATKQTGWNASFIRSDATVGTLADRMGVQRGDILDKETGNMAVRLAIGETMLVKENKEFFAREGVDLDAIEGALVKPGAAGAAKKKIERSTSVILVKNLPHTTEEDELAQLFRKHGDIGRFLLAPSKTLALVEFFEPSEARRAFRSLAYKKYQHVPLYLEWAPVKVFNAALKKSTTAGTSAGVKTTAAALGVPEGEDVDGGGGDDDSAAAEANNTLCVKNLSFNTKEPALEALFRGVGKVRKVTVARRKDPKRGLLSMGFGFVEFADATHAEKALASLQNTVLDGHALNIRLSQKKIAAATGDSSAKRKAPGGDASTGRQTKIMVRNVAFEATSNEIRELFGAFGQLKRVRMPKKFDGSHRGFAFVEFLTEQEAQAAFRALVSSHLYGRHLVLEWATDADDMDALRAKASRDLTAISESDRRKRAKQSKEEQEDGGDGDY